MTARGKKAAKPAAKSAGASSWVTRVSTTDQDLTVQREALHGAGVSTIVEEKRRP